MNVCKQRLSNQYLSLELKSSFGQLSSHKVISYIFENHFMGEKAGSRTGLTAQCVAEYWHLFLLPFDTVKYHAVLGDKSANNWTFVFTLSCTN